MILQLITKVDEAVGGLLHQDSNPRSPLVFPIETFILGEARYPQRGHLLSSGEGRPSGLLRRPGQVQRLRP